MKYILCIDIGGTNPRMAIVSVNEKKIFNIIESANINGNSLEKSTNIFLEVMKKEKNISTDKCVISIAGIVNNNKCIEPTNTNIKAEPDKIKKETKLKNILIINDFEAIGYAVSTINIEKALKTRKIVEIKKGNPILNEKRAVIGPGTGLGICYLNYDKETKKYSVMASEGGHGPALERENLEKLYLWIRNKDKTKTHIEMEELISGQGIRNIAEYFLKNSNDFETFIKKEKKYQQIIGELEQFKTKQKELDEYLLNCLSDNSKDFSEEISKAQFKNFKASTTMNLFAEFLALSCQQVALNSLSRGGVFIAGGIITKNPHLFQRCDFNLIFNDNSKNNIKELLEKIPVYYITDYDISFIGCAKVGDEKLN